MSYRLGMYGFMYFPETEEGEQYNGNWGLLDQMTAMKWAQQFAPAFGGDVTQASF